MGEAVAVTVAAVFGTVATVLFVGITYMSWKIRGTMQSEGKTAAVMFTLQPAIPRAMRVLTAAGILFSIGMIVSLVGRIIGSPLLEQASRPTGLVLFGAYFYFHYVVMNRTDVEELKERI